MILQFPHLGKQGRLGNQLFQIASTIGIALKNKMQPRFPADWQYREHFNIPDEYFGEMQSLPVFNEPKFEYCDIVITKPCSLSGYFQSWKYFEHCKEEIIKYLTPKGVVPSDCVAVHHRRGDYIGNPNYVTLPMSYYCREWACSHFAKGFSDDKDFLKLHYKNYGTGNEIEDLKEMIGCKGVICSNSTFSWWAAYLQDFGFPIRPNAYFAGELAKRCSTVDFWHDDFYEVPVSKSKLNATFVIPVMYDHPDRLENCKAVCAFLTEHFDCEILIGEVNGDHFKGIPGTTHIRFEMSHFHRTKIINDLTRRASYDIVFNWDADVICSPLQIGRAYNQLRNGWAEICYPYDGTFYFVSRHELPNMKGDLDGLKGKKFHRVGASPADPNSYGGAVAYDREAFFRAGGENENFISYGPEDQERYMRFKALGLEVSRADGPLYHIDHARGPNSSFNHEYGKNNIRYFEYISRLNLTDLKKHINSWPWLK